MRQESLAIAGSMEEDYLPVESCLRFVGGKRWLAVRIASIIRGHLARTDGTYCEPFAGSLAVGLAVGWHRATYADTAPDVVNLYVALAEDAGAVADEVDALRALEGEEVYYQIRESVWPGGRESLSPSAWAARMVWINRHCYNGMVRYARRTGRLNVPWGKRRGVTLPSREHLLQIGAALHGRTILRTDFGNVLDVVLAESGDLSRRVFYLDPPYGGRLENESGERPGMGDGVYTEYAGAFTWTDQVRLARGARALVERGALVLASNAWTKPVCALYQEGFHLHRLGVQHSVGATGARRGRRLEMLAVSEAHAHLFGPCLV